MDMIKKNKVIFVIGSTGTGKSKLAVDIATHFSGEIINSDKVQLHKGLPIVCNKINIEETRGIPHHLIDVLEPDDDFTAKEFRVMAMDQIDAIVARGNVPIVAGGSNSFVEELVEGNNGEFKSKYDYCFLWIDVSLVSLFPHLARRIDKMVEAGLVEEVMEAFDVDKDDYTRGVRCAIGVPEIHGYFRDAATTVMAGEKDTTVILDKAINMMKVNTCRLAEVQVRKIFRLMMLPGWKVHKLDATKVIEDKENGLSGDETWEELIWSPTLNIVTEFLEHQDVEEDTESLLSSTP